MTKEHYDSAARDTKQLVEIIIPVYNEEVAIQYNLQEIFSHLNGMNIADIVFKVLVVDDGSTDDTVSIVKSLCEQNEKLELLCLNRNFGKESAIHAGLRYSSGNAVIVMDSDLQHPPALIERMVKLWQNKISVVDACKAFRGKEAVSTKMFATGFYFIFKRITGIDITNHSDFKLLDQEVVAAYCSLPERKRFFRGMVPWLGYSNAQLFFDVSERQHGTSGWSKLKLWRFALTAITSFSSAPLHLISFLGVLCFLLSITLGGIALYHKYTGQAVSGFTTVVLLLLLIGSLIMFGLWLIGVYIEQLFDEIKQRPTYMINKRKSTLKI